jgi:NitT/TauT family transport system substrate-binding protein
MRASIHLRGRYLLTLSCALVLLACSPAPRAAPADAPAASAGAPAAAAPAAQLPAQPESGQPLTHVAIGYGAIAAAYIPLWMAGEMKAFEKYGIDAELVHLPGNTGPQSLVSGQVPIVGLSGFASAPSMIEGADLLILTASILRHTAQMYGVYGVDSPQVLRGKRLGITRPGTLTHFGALVALREWGLKPDQDVTLVSLNETAAILTGMVSGAVDAGMLADPNSFAAAKEGFPLLVDLSDYPTEYISAGITTTRDYAQQNRALLLNVLRAYLEGHRRYFDDRALAVDVLSKYARVEDPEVLEQTYRLYAEKYFVRNPFPSVRGIQNILDDYAQVNPRAKEVDATRLVDASFMQELQREGFLRAIGLE